MHTAVTHTIGPFFDCCYMFVCLFLAFICSSLKKGKFLDISIGVIDKGIMCQVFLTAGLGVTRGKDTQGKYCPQDLPVVLH